MKNKIKKIIQVFLVFVIMITLTLVYFGVQDYNSLMLERPLDQRVNDIISDDDFVSFSEISKMTKDAIVATEDERLYARKSPLDFKAIGRATFRISKTLDW